MAFIKNTLLKIAFAGPLLYFGFSSLSDAFVIFLVVTFITLVLTIFIPKRNLLVFLLPTLVLISIGMAFFYSELAVWLAQKWIEADQGHFRLTLYINGLAAWLSSPLTFLNGNGAGAFSGLTGPFQQLEVHNTPIEILTIGGLFGLFCFYYFPIKYTIITYMLDQKIVFACAVALISFSLFHFVARHPIFWFTIFALSEFAWMQKKQGSR